MFTTYRDVKNLLLWTCLDVLNLFDKIKSEQSGQLDLLVNNAYAGVDTIFKVSTV